MMSATSSASTNLSIKALAVPAEDPTESIDLRRDPAREAQAHNDPIVPIIVQAKAAAESTAPIVPTTAQTSITTSTTAQTGSTTTISTTLAITGTPPSAIDPA